MPRFLSHLAALVAPLPRVPTLVTKRFSSSLYVRLFGDAPLESLAASRSSPASASVPSVNDAALLSSNATRSPSGKRYASSLSVQAPGVAGAPRLPSALAGVRSDRRRAAFHINPIETPLRDDIAATTLTTPSILTSFFAPASVPSSTARRPVISTPFIQHSRSAATVAVTLTSPAASSIPFPRTPTRASRNPTVVLSGPPLRSPLARPRKTKTASRVAILPSIRDEIEQEEPKEPECEDLTATDPRFVDLRSLTRPRQKLRAWRRKVDNGRWLTLLALENANIARKAAVAEARAKAQAVLEQDRRPFLENDDDDDDTSYFAQLPTWNDARP
ncbi:BZ3500_MvSof-1268-A1-R1_Chr6-3g08873 [Microbotryum saponariae]|uniref:BZ3500_MvSof-1268-A1-R1_Chr6-3g08873 protein n=1 Tax=Microbotryum saponariae TaxID=289078 RepID=A0A2X0MHJ1_9BASI|nr:BZ3500_MvSof-1268-A1-R1_Chr6-3g08873 [Microbotryum saponariae]SDA07474.1 BZ3501_MvSof-1269-A2-R1_Chr6-2g08576 [Microbotryum saponariae]